MDGKNCVLGLQVLPFDTNTNNVVKFILINIIFAPLLKHALWLVLCRVATLHVLQGRKVRIQETRSGHFGVVGFFFGGPKGRLTALILSCVFIGFSLLTEYGFGTTLVDTVTPVQVFAPISFPSLTTSNIVDRTRRPGNWLVRQSSFCMGELETYNFKDKNMIAGGILTRRLLLKECEVFARSQPSTPAITRYMSACQTVGQAKYPVMGYMVLNWTKSVEFREGAVSYPDSEVLCLGNTRAFIESRGLILGAGWDHNHPDRLFMLPRYKDFINSFSMSLKILHGSLGPGSEASQPVLVDGRGSSCASWSGHGNLLCLSITAGKSMLTANLTGRHQSVLRIALTKGVPALSVRQQVRKNSLVQVDVHTIWIYIEVPIDSTNVKFTKKGSQEVSKRRQLVVFDLANLPRLNRLSGRARRFRKTGPKDPQFIEDSDLTAAAEVLLATMKRSRVNIVPARNISAEKFVSEKEHATKTLFASLYFMGCGGCILFLFITQFVLNFYINRRLSRPGTVAQLPSVRNFALSCYRPRWSVQLSADWLLWKAYNDIARNADCTQFEDTDVALGLTENGVSYRLGIVPPGEKTVRYTAIKPIK